MENIILVNLFRKQQDLVQKLGVLVKNFSTIRDVPVIERQTEEYRQCVAQLLNVSAMIDHAFDLPQSTGPLKELYQEDERLWSTVLANRKVLCSALAALKDLQYSAGTLVGSVDPKSSSP